MENISNQRLLTLDKKITRIKNQRLLKFAKHIEKIKNHPKQDFHGTVYIIEREERISMVSDVVYLQWIFEELPAIFNNWYIDNRGNPLWNDSDFPKSTLASVIEFFILSRDEFEHLFDLGGLQSVECFGGKTLTRDATGFDIAFNIKELVKNNNLQANKNKPFSFLKEKWEE